MVSGHDDQRIVCEPALIQRQQQLPKLREIVASVFCFFGNSREFNIIPRTPAFFVGKSLAADLGLIPSR